jgi:hypothetical protein
MELNGRLDTIGELQDTHEDRIARLTRAHKRLSSRVDALEEDDGED